MNIFLCSVGVGAEGSFGNPSLRDTRLAWARLLASSSIKLALVLAAGWTTVTSRGLFQPIVFYYFMRSVE